MRINGGCHCGNIGYVLDWPGDDPAIQVRACSCSFCVMHGAVYTSHPDAALSALIQRPASVSQYRFATGSAGFYVCSRCGGMPFVTSEIEGRLYAVVNVNSFEEADRFELKRKVTNFEREGVGSRLERRRRTWIPRVIVEEGGSGLSADS